MDRSQSAPIIIGKLMNIGGMLQRLGNRMLMPFDLNHQQYSVFFEIWKAGKVKQKDMVNRLVLEKAHVSKIVKKLHNMGLISITQSDEDKRSYWLSPTPKGNQVLKECRKMFKAWNREWAGSLDKEQITSALENLTHLQTVLKEHIQPDNM